jgi:hypothetical protein
MQVKVKNLAFILSDCIGPTKPTCFPWTSLMALSESGHIPVTTGEKMHHEEGIVIVGGGFGGLFCAAALHKYIFTP